MKPDVIVIGAGVAGLSAAVRLAAAGKRVLVVESLPRLGGRASTFADPATGERVDNGQHVLFGCYRDTYRFLETIGVDRLAPPDRRLRVRMADATGRAHTLSCPSLPPPWHLLAGVVKWRAVPFRNRLSVLRLANVLRRPDVASGVSRTDTVTTWLRAHGQSPALCRWLWNPLAFAALNQSPDEAAAAPFVRVLRELFGPRPEDSAIALPTVPLDKLFGLPAARFLATHGATVLSSTPARLSLNDGHVVVHAGGRTFEPAAAISAVPWHAFSGLWIDTPPPEIAGVCEAADRMASSPIVTVNFWFDRGVVGERCVGLVDGDVHWAFDTRSIFGGTASHMSVVASGASRLAPMTNDEIAEVALQDLRRALPAIRLARLERSLVVRERRATFSLALDQPARPRTSTMLPGFFLAGDWIDTGLPATIEGAVRSGHAAADEVLKWGLIPATETSAQPQAAPTAGSRRR